MITITKASTQYLKATAFTDVDNLVSANLAGASMYFICKLREKDADSKKLFEKTIGSGIIVSGNSIYITLSATDTTIDANYVFVELVIKAANNDIIRTGIMKVKLEDRLKITNP